MSSIWFDIATILLRITPPIIRRIARITQGGHVPSKGAAFIELDASSGLLTVDSSTGDMSSKGMFEVFEYQTDGSLNLNYLWNPKDGMTTPTS
jgi:hypothetical protein